MYLYRKQVLIPSGAIVGVLKQEEVCLAGRFLHMLTYGLINKSFFFFFLLLDIWHEKMF